MLEVEDLKEGRLPVSKYEIVVSDSGYQIGDTLLLGFDYPYYKDGEPTLADVEGEIFVVVGITKNINPYSWQDYFYFTDEYLMQDDILTEAYLGTGWGNAPVDLFATIEPTPGETLFVSNFYDIVYDDTIPVGEVYVGYGMLQEICYSLGVFITLEGDLIDDCIGQELTLLASSNFYTHEAQITIAGELDPTAEYREWNYSVSINKQTISNLIELEPYQMTLFVMTPYEADLLMQDLEEMDNLLYVYPAVITGSDNPLMQFINTLTFSMQLFLLLGVMYFITYLVLRNIQNAKIKDFLIFRSIGASKKDLHLITIIELVYVFVLGFILVMAFVLFNEFNQIWIFPQYLVYFTVSSYFILVGLSIFLAVLLGRRFNTRIFGRSVITSLKQE